MTPLVLALAASSPVPVLRGAAGLFVFGLALAVRGWRGRDDGK